MKITFFIPKTKKFIADTDPLLPRCGGTKIKAPYLWPPTGMASLATIIDKKFGYDCEIFDARIKNLPLEKQIEHVGNSDYLVLDPPPPLINEFLDLSKKIKEESDVRIVFIGIFSTTFPNLLKNESSVDFVISGSPENGVIKLFTKKQKNKIIMAEPVKNLNSLPIADRDFLKNDKYYDILAKNKRIATLLSARGCPFKCNFCSANLYGDFQQRSLENIFKELTNIEERKISDIMFLDDTFTLNKKRVLNICSFLGESNIDWRCLSRVDTLDKPLLLKMKESGCYQIRFGVESGSQLLLDKMNKNITIEQTKKIFKICDEIGIETIAFFMPGYPGETKETLVKTYELIKEIKPDFISFNNFTPIPGSPIFDKMFRGKKLNKADFKKFDFMHSFCSLKTSYLNKRITEFYKKYYINFGYLFRRVKKTREPWRIFIQNLNFWRFGSGF